MRTSENFKRFNKTSRTIKGIKYQLFIQVICADYYPLTEITAAGNRGNRGNRQALRMMTTENSEIQAQDE
ncbi:MAG: hypothetical protein J6X83_02250 [Methanomicrobium sp.]|uniref:hypothetical protein n=1 Tax=Methanomicrobium mobile TaxID=2205 RepID=UPI0005B27FA7|nr:hypothetical protein [Methanomicrobium mobile]MBP5082987.1 hypothetical protein [Methanomicrobium sp.]MBP5475068.1 hypothetical protein [Methanomicrobium sp.]